MYMLQLFIIAFQISWKQVSSNFKINTLVVDGMCVR